MSNITASYFSDMGAHIDGFIAVVAHTLVVGNKGEKIKGRKADVILAAHYASEAALRLIRPGNTVMINWVIFLVFL